MCEELGDETYMEQYVLEAGKTSTCSAETEKGCSEKEKKYIGEWKQKSPDEINAQKSRLEGLVAKSSQMKPEVFQWINQRLAVLKQLGVSDVSGDEL